MRCSMRKARYIRVLRGTLPSVVVAAILLVLGEWGCYLAGVVPLAHTTDPMVGFAGYAPLFVPDGQGNLETAQNKRRYFPVQRFPEEKTPGTSRVFCLGGSTTAGRPYGDGTSFCGWLRELLPQAGPEHSWEVINAGGISYASYRVARVMEELLAYEPDLFVVYTGHNEFLERRTYRSVREAPRWIGRLLQELAETRLYTLVHRAVHQRPELAPKADALPVEVFPILDRSMGPEAYTPDAAYASQVVVHFEANLRRMVAMARSVGARIILITPASNESDCAPFKPADGGACYRRGVREGRADLLRRVRDEDICPLRATTPLVEAVRRVAREEGVPLVDFEARMSDNALGVPGGSDFVDHLHPTVRVHGTLAGMIADAMADQGMLPGTPSERIPEVAPGILARVDHAAEAKALRTVARVYAWAGKWEEGLAKGRAAYDMVPDDPDNAMGLMLLLVARSERYSAVGRHAEALKLAGQAVEVSHRENPAVLCWYATCQAALGDAAAAASTAREALLLPNLDDFGSLRSTLKDLVSAGADALRAPPETR